MGHTNGGDCSGDVLYFDNSRKIYLRTVDLYGCGVCGIGCNNFSGDLYVSNSTIRDCEFGPFEIFNGEGDFRFTACTLSGSGGGGYFGSNETSQLSFVGCFFGQQESNEWVFRKRLHLKIVNSCLPDEYPDFDYSDYEEYVPVFDPEQMTEIAFDKSMLGSTSWVGYAAADPQSGDMRYLGMSGPENADADYAYLFLDEDGTGWLEYRHETLDLEWDQTDAKLACLENAEHSLYASLYQNEDSDYWLLMQYDNELIWFY
jgi:hypothetical protein